MTIIIDKARSDGKFQIRYCFTNGVVLTKIKTPAQVTQDVRRLGPQYAEFDCATRSWTQTRFETHYE
jgi:hypothetical protein